MIPVHDSAIQGLIVAGIGCDRQASVTEMQALLQDCLRIARIDPGRLQALATVELKADEPGLLALAERLNLPLKVFSVAVLEAQTPRLATPSAAVFRAIGCHGVAEAAALAAVGPSGQLLLPKQRSARATCALAISAATAFV